MESFTLLWARCVHAGGAGGAGSAACIPYLRAFVSDVVRSRFTGTIVGLDDWEAGGFDANIAVEAVDWLALKKAWRYRKVRAASLQANMPALACVTG